MNEVKNDSSEDVKVVGQFFVDLESGHKSLPGSDEITGVRVSLNGYEVLLVFTRMSSAGNKEIAFCGSESMAGACRKARKLWGTARWTWKRDKYEA